MNNFKFLVLFIGSLYVLFSAISMAVEKPQTPNEPYREKNMGMPRPGGECTPTTCEQAKAVCGNISDGCGKVLECGIAKSVSVTVDPPQFTGICPKTFRFTGTITTDKKGTARYIWSRGPVLLKEGDIVFNGAGTKQVIYEWSVPHSLPSDQQWLSFSACGADPVKAVFTVHCTNLKPKGGKTLPQ